MPRSPLFTLAVLPLNDNLPALDMANALADEFLAEAAARGCDRVLAEKAVVDSLFGTPAMLRIERDGDLDAARDAARPYFDEAVTHYTTPVVR